MTAITREYLDALDLQVLDRPHSVNPREVRDLIAALRRVLDLADEADEDHARYMEGPILDRFIAPSNVHTSKLRAALAGTQTEAVPYVLRCNRVPNGCVLRMDHDGPCQRAGTQTDDGAGGSTPAVSSGGESAPGQQSPAPAPSSPDRIEAVAQALYGGRRWAEQTPEQVTYWRTMAEVAVAALDAYDREHPTPATAYWKRVADRREEALDTLGRERNTWARLMADLRDERDAAKRDAEDARREKNDAQNERDDLDHRLADLRERIAADIEADVLLSPFSGGREVNAYNHGARNAASHAARIVRSGVPRTEEARTGPHSRACGIKRHDHGTECHSNCPTCRGSEVPR